MPRIYSQEKLKCTKARSRSCVHLPQDVNMDELPTTLLASTKWLSNPNSHLPPVEGESKHPSDIRICTKEHKSKVIHVCLPRTTSNVMHIGSTNPTTNHDNGGSHRQLPVIVGFKTNSGDYEESIPPLVVSSRSHISQQPSTILRNCETPRSQASSYTRKHSVPVQKRNRTEVVSNSPYAQSNCSLSTGQLKSPQPKRSSVILCNKCYRKYISGNSLLSDKVMMSRLSLKDKEVHKQTPLEGLERKRSPFRRGLHRGNSLTGRMLSPPSEPSSLLRQNQELRQRLQEEANNYRKRIDTYKQAQSNQAALVSRLQNKVLQYKQRCADLEVKIHDTPRIIPSSKAYSILDKNPLDDAPISLPCTSSGDQSLGHRDFRDDGSELYRRLEDERLKCEQLLAQNNLLRSQLEESHQTNEALTNDLQKLTSDWVSVRDDMITKEDEWKEQEQAFNDYYNSEQNRVLKMWRDVVSVKRMFKDMQSEMVSDLYKMRSDINCANREAMNACSGVNNSIRHQSRTDESNLAQVDRVNKELKTQLQTLQSQYEAGKKDIDERDRRIEQLLGDIKALEEKYQQADNQASQAVKMNDEIDRLQIALRDIAHAVVLDADGSGDVTSSQHMHLTQSTLVPPRSPKRGQMRTSQAFAEGTISAVQAALHKYQLSIHDLQVKLQTTTDTLNVTKKQLDAADETKELLSTSVSDLTNKLDSSNHQISELCKERDSLKQLLDTMRLEKQNVERAKVELNSILEGLNLDYEKLQSGNSKLQKMVTALEEEKKLVELDLQRVNKEREISEMNMRAEEERASRFREETITLREELNKLYLTRDLLEQQRVESESYIGMLEKQKADLEYNLENVQCAKDNLQAQCENLTSCKDNQECELKQLKQHIEEIDREKNKYSLQCNELTSDVGALKKELLSAEQIRLELESTRLTLGEKIKTIEMDKEKLDQDVNQLNREREDLMNQLVVVNRKKENLNEELMRTRQRLEQATETNSRVNRNLEELIKDNEEKQVSIECNEKEIQKHQEMNAALRTEKESLEAVLFDANTSLEATEIKKHQLENEVQDLLVKQEGMKNHINRLAKELDASERRCQDVKIQLTNAASNQESEFLQKIENLKTFHEENVHKLNEEKDQLRISLEKKMQQAVQSLEGSKDSEVNSLREQLEGLQLHLESLCQQHEETMIRAENEKQQSLLLAHRDKQAVVEKLEQLMRDLKVETENLDRIRRDNVVRTEKDRSTIAALKDELARVKTRTDELRTRSEDDINKLNIQLSGLSEERDMAHREIENLKTQLRISEDRSENFNAQLQDTLRQLKECESQNESNRKELLDTKRILADCNIERDKYAGTNKDLRDQIKRIETHRREQSRHLDESQQKINSLEDTRAGLEKEKIRLTTLLKETDNNVVRLNHELQALQSQIQKQQSINGQKEALEKELNARLQNEQEEKERIIQELQQAKKQLADLDANLHCIRQELGKSRCKGNQDEHRYHTREQELISRIEDGRSREKRLEDQKHNLEVCLADATQQIQELKARLGGAEGRVRALDEQLAIVEANKKDTENKLSSIGHTLRRIAGVQLDGSVTLPYRLLSPSRRYSPARGGHEYDCRSVSGDGPMIDVDPEMVRKGVRTLMSQVAYVEREKDDFKSQLCTVKKQLQECTDNLTRSENKISKLQQTLRSVQDEKANIESKLTQKSSNLQNVEEILRQKSEELNHLREKVVSLELQLGSGAEERGQCENRLDKSKQAIQRLESEKRQLQEELSRCEGRASKLDLHKVALEGDIHRLQMALQEKDSTLRSIQERLESQERSSTQLEDRCAALKSSVDQLKERLQAAALTETELRAEVSCMQKQHSEKESNVLAGQDKVKYLQKSLTTSENERRILVDRLEASQASINELRRNQQGQMDLVTRLQEQLAELEVQKSTLESQLRITKWNQDNTTETNAPSHLEEDLARQVQLVQREKQELKHKIENLNEKIRLLEDDRRSKYTGHHVHYDKGCDGQYDSNRLETDSAVSKGHHHFHCGLDHSLIEQENRDLRLKVRRLETMLAEKEAELARTKARILDSTKIYTDSDKYKSAQQNAERILDAREQSHRQQVLRLENQISMLREQLAQEAKRRQMYILRSSRAGREMQHLRETLGDSLRTVAHDPLDTDLLESERRRLDTAVSMSLPPHSGRDYDRSLSPRYK